jgi:thiol-disulfide isomerase/thioredoxin
MVLLHAALAALALSGNPQPELLDFYADWCIPCHSMDSTVRELAARGYPVRRVNVDQDRALAAQFGVHDIPCFVMLVDGRAVDRVVGATSLSRLEQMCSLGRQTAPPAVPAAPVMLAAHVSTPRTAPAYAAPARPNPAPPAPVAPPAADAALLAASVRLSIEDSDGRSCGSGTIIFARPGEALVLTCAHIFRESQGKGRIEVDLFGPQSARVPGRLVGYDLKRDVGLVAIAPPVAVAVARVAPPGYPIRPGDPVASVGCNNGDAPSAQRSQVVSPDHFPGYIQVAGQPVVGRSGGGLFSADGLVIGVCNAADPGAREGFFAALGPIQAELDELGLAWLYTPARPAAPATALAAAPGGPANTGSGSPPGAAPRVRIPAPVADAAPASTVAVDRGGLAPGEQAALDEIHRRVMQGAEVVCIIRDRHDPDARSQVISLDRASAAFVDQLSAAARPASGRVPTSLDIPRSRTPILEWDLESGWRHNEPLPRPGS